MEKKKRLATRGICEELRDMNVGDVVQFSMIDYNYNTVRAAPSSALGRERCNGMMWRTRVNWAEKCVDVTRTA